jgi:hypothetical protein
LDLNVILLVQYHLPPKRYITWPFIFEVLNGTKKLLKQNQVKINVIPPRIKHLRIKEIWTHLKEDEDLLRFFPNQCLKYEPPRSFFFTILSTVKPHILVQLLNSAENHYLEKKAEELCCGN